ncbi:hypothetical protein BGZ73_007058 [Actinomortierella ambigua]|nr:hypothetical protein BGZ73_007058 [Actinomortierella ambigua]
MVTSSTSPQQQQPTSERPRGRPRCIVRIDRDHRLADEATRFDGEQFAETFIGRITQAEFKGTIQGINECMRVAEEPFWNCIDTMMDVLTAYTAKYCCGTHYQRAMKKLEAFIDHENKQLYHPAKMHLRDPQRTGMIYLEFEVY